MKYCKRCDTTKPLDDFYNNRSSKTGKSDYCKTCTKAYMRDQAIRHADRIATYSLANRDRRLADKRAKYAADAEAQRERTRKWRKANPDLVREQNRRWAAENPERDRDRQSRRRARQRNLPSYLVTDKDLRRLFQGPCAAPGCESHDVQLDHIIPVARGGSHGIGNLQPLCKQHNCMKKDKTWMEFRVYLALKQRLAA